MKEVKRDTWCRHRTPFTDAFKTCRVDVDFHQFMGGQDTGPQSTMPCLGESEAAKARCDKYSGWTVEEIATREEDMRGRFARLGIIRRAIVEANKATGEHGGTLDCPACKTGTVSWSMARSNGHIHARCSTPDCAAWME